MTAEYRAFDGRGPGDCAQRAAASAHRLAHLGLRILRFEPTLGTVPNRQGKQIVLRSYASKLV